MESKTFISIPKISSLWSSPRLLIRCLCSYYVQLKKHCDFFGVQDRHQPAEHGYKLSTWTQSCRSLEHFRFRSSQLHSNNYKINSQFLPIINGIKLICQSPEHRSYALAFVIEVNGTILSQRIWNTGREDSNHMKILIFP